MDVNDFFFFFNLFRSASLKLPQNALSDTLPAFLGRLSALGKYTLLLIKSFRNKSLMLLMGIQIKGHLDLSSNLLDGALLSSIGSMGMLSKLIKATTWSVEGTLA